MKNQMTQIIYILEEEKTNTLYFLTVFCSSFRVYMKYSIQFRNPFLYFLRLCLLQNIIFAAHFVNFYAHIFGQKCLALHN